MPVLEQGQPAPHPDQAAGAAQQQPVLFWGVRLVFPLFPSLRWKLLTALQLLRPDVCCFGWGGVLVQTALVNSFLASLQGIGNTFQGGANCIMFVLCTRVVRARLLSSLCCCHYDDSGWPSTRSSSTRQRPDPAGSEDVPDPERTKTLLSST